jgi:hypothetical protein
MGAIKPWQLIFCLLLTIGVAGVLAAVAIVVKRRR